MRKNEPKKIKRKEMLAFLIKQSGMTYEEVAEAINISKSTLEKYRMGKLEIPLDIVASLSLLLVTTVEDIRSSKVREMKLDEITIYEWEEAIVQKVIELAELLH